MKRTQSEHVASHFGYYNSDFLVSAIRQANAASSSASPLTPASPRPRYSKRPLPAHYVLGSTLPAYDLIERKAIKHAHQARRDHILQTAIDTALQTPLDAKPAPKADNARRSSASGSASGRRASSSSAPKSGTGKGKAEPFELLRAIEKKDLAAIMELRQRDFPLLVQVVGGSTPLVHAMRLGKSHREVAIILTGAISKKVNELASLEDESPLHDPSTQGLLRAIRANLKIAIQYGLQSAETDLISSYLQVSVMSHGDRWLSQSVHHVTLALRAGKEGKPVHTAETIMRKWATREVKDLAAVGEFEANAVWDLILLAFWNIVTDKVPGEAIPSHYYGRDSRIAVALQERVAELEAAGKYTNVPKATRETLQRVIDIVCSHSASSRTKIERIRELIDAS